MLLVSRPQILKNGLEIIISINDGARNLNEYFHIHVDFNWYMESI